MLFVVIINKLQTPLFLTKFFFYLSNITFCCPKRSLFNTLNNSLIFPVKDVLSADLNKTTNLFHSFFPGMFIAQNDIIYLVLHFAHKFIDRPLLANNMTNKVYNSIALLRFTTHIGIYSGLIRICLPPLANILS